MHFKFNRYYTGAVYLVMIALFSQMGCYAGHPEVTAEGPAGFWFGLWHGAISWLSFFIGLFNDSVNIYETNNSGGWYDFGFLLGVSCIWGSTNHFVGSCSPRIRKWKKVEDKWEKRMHDAFERWAAEEDDEEWIELSVKVKNKLKKKLREWAEKEE